MIKSNKPPKLKNKSLVVSKLLSDFTFSLRKHTGITFGDGYLQAKVAFSRLLDKYSRDYIQDAMHAFFLDRYALEHACPWQLFIKAIESYHHKFSNLSSIISIPELLNKHWRNEETGKMYDEIKDSPTAKEKVIELRVIRGKLGTTDDVSLEDVERAIAKIGYMKGKEAISEDWIRAYVKLLGISTSREETKKAEDEARFKRDRKIRLKYKVRMNESYKLDFQEFFNLYFGFKDPVNKQIQIEIALEDGVTTIGSKRYKYQFIDYMKNKYRRELTFEKQFLIPFMDCRDLEDYVVLYETIERNIMEAKNDYRKEILDYLLPGEESLYE